MSKKEKQQQEQEEFTPRHCTIMTERYLMNVVYYSKDWQSVTVYERKGEMAKYHSHGTYSIDINDELKPYLFYIENEDIEEKMLQITSFIYYINSVVYDAIRWMEFWKEVDIEDEDKEVAELLNHFYETGEVDSERKASVVEKLQNVEEDEEVTAKVTEVIKQMIAD